MYEANLMYRNLRHRTHEKIILEIKWFPIPTSRNLKHTPKDKLTIDSEHTAHSKFERCKPKITVPGPSTFERLSTNQSNFGSCGFGGGKHKTGRAY
jgi:hypothetical protein